MAVILYQIIDFLARLLVLVIIVDAVLSFFMSPYHPVREALGRVLNPIYAPIRRLVRPVGGVDFSPLILLIVIQVLAEILKRLLIPLM